ncbi:hypothetical protein [Anaplasma capra]|uniref:hypothetical protein n=1 Tax=Anaplasma capra TaxID=1562740 RepID=UPI0021D580C7|nr:hypothetical protein [Anaplasma capra]MCU7611656.1 hypothetical protein [Anaplasma capra]MCU7612195.1 hypothetical protein [Anaplasma capra]
MNVEYANEAEGEGSEKCTRGSHDVSSHKEKVILGCMIFLSITLGSFLVHGAIESIQDGSTLFFIMNMGGFFAVIAIMSLLRDSSTLMRMYKDRERILNRDAAGEAGTSFLPAVGLGTSCEIEEINYENRTTTRTKFRTTLSSPCRNV